MQQYEFRVKPNASMWPDSRKFNFACFGEAPCIIEEKIIRSLRSKSNPAQPQRMYIQGPSFKSVQFSLSVMYDSLRLHEPQHARPPCPSPTPRVQPNPCPLSQWGHPTILTSVIPFSSCPQSFPASGSFPMSQVFTWGSQSIGVAASTSVLPMNTQDWSPLGWTGWISLQSKGPARVFSNTTVQKHQSLGTQLSSQSNSHMHTWPLDKP